MKTYICSFWGRTNGAIGVIHQITARVYLEKVKTGEDVTERVRLELYKDFEHIRHLTFKEEV